MGEVIALSDYQPHLTGDAKCLACGYEWVAVAPTGVFGLTCPECETDKGVFAGFCIPDTPVWTCLNCNNVYFYLCPEEIICALCGTAGPYSEIY